MPGIGPFGITVLPTQKKPPRDTTLATRHAERGAISPKPYRRHRSPTEVYREFNNLMRLTGREQVSHKTLSELVAELELYGFVEVKRKGRRRGRGVDFYISQQNR